MTEKAIIISKELSNKRVLKQDLRKSVKRHEVVAFLAPRDFSYATCLLGIWMSGAIAVPLCPDHPPAEMLHVLNDSKASLLIHHPDYNEKVKEVVSGTKLELEEHCLNSEYKIWNNSSCSSYAASPHLISKVRKL